ncbi:MAG: endonuclease/exonuclease/phosphatase family protein, partial [Xanthomonadales bacterium]|nr:endonuclease/exonuclease/phosphatase family protein [Xanthomonadales bacterium]
LNYFNGDGRGGGFPTARGANTPREFREQRRRIGAALAKMQPQLLAVQELENDGFGPDSAARSLLAVLNESAGDDWAVIEVAGGIGQDLIAVGLFYRTQILEAVGKARVLEAPEFRGLSRAPLAQHFRHRDSGHELLLAVNHLKSKGRCPDGGENADQGDGQACWNVARSNAVRALLPWLQQLARNMGTENLLIVGDMNSWRHEDPIGIFRQAGYLDLAEELSGRPQHSFRYRGQLGTLDYAFASPALAVRAVAAQNWPANAIWPRKITPPEPWLRVSDHDPVIVDFDFSHSATSN